MATVPTSVGYEAKFRWGKEHARVFEKEVSLARGHDRHRIVPEDDPNSHEYVFKIHFLSPTNPDWGLRAGDAIHNLRSALDHLVYQLAILGQDGRDLTEDEARGCEFPIYDDLGKFPDPRKSGALKLLRPGERTRITELQPFNAWDPSIWGLSHASFKYARMGGAFVPTMLERLRVLDNIDKHRTVNATWRMAEWFRAPLPPAPFSGGGMSVGAVEDDAVIGRWGYTAPRPELPPDMDMDRYFPIGVALGDPPYMLSAIELLNALTTAVGIVLELFRPCIAVGAAALPIASIAEPA